jgi:hypothetical protein
METGNADGYSAGEIAVPAVWLRRGRWGRWTELSTDQSSSGRTASALGSPYGCSASCPVAQLCPADPPTTESHAFPARGRRRLDRDRLRMEAASAERGTPASAGRRPRDTPPAPGPVQSRPRAGEAPPVRMVASIRSRLMVQERTGIGPNGSISPGAVARVRVLHEGPLPRGQQVGFGGGPHRPVPLQRARSAR